MNRNLILPIVFPVFLLSLFSAAPVFSETPDDHWQEVLGEIEEETSEVRDDNSRLIAEHIRMVEEYAALEKKIRFYKDQLEQTDTVLKSNSPKAAKLYASATLSPELLKLQKENKELEQEYAVMVKKNQLKQLQLDDLKYTRRSRMLEYKMQGAKYAMEANNALLKEEQQTEALREELRTYQKELNALRAKKKAERFDDAEAKEERELKAETSRLQSELNLVKDQNKIEEKKLEQFMHENENFLTATQKILNEKTDERNLLESKISILEAQRLEVQDSLDDLTDAQKRKRILVSKLMELDKTNQDLRQRVEELAKSVETLEAENDLQDATTSEITEEK